MSLPEGIDRSPSSSRNPAERMRDERGGATERQLERPPNTGRFNGSVVHPNEPPS